MATLSLDDLVARAQQIAVGTGTDSSLSLLNDSDLTIEALVDHCLNHVAAEWNRDSAKRAQLRSSTTLTFSNGVATIPAGLAEDWPMDAEWYSANESFNGLVTFCPHRGDAMHHRKAFLWYVWVDGTTVNLTTGMGDGVTGDVTLIVARQPAFSSGTLTAPDHFCEDLVLRVAAALRGDLPLPLLAGLPLLKKK